MVLFYFIGIVFFILLQAFFAASEIAFISSSPLRLRHRKETGDLQAAEVYKVMLKPENFLATVLVGINFSVVISTALLTSLLVKMDVANSNIWITCLFTPFVVIFAELVPKDVGRVFREEFSCHTVRWFKILEKTFISISQSIEMINRLLVKLFLRKARPRSLFVTREEIKSLLKEIKRSGVIDRGEQEAIEEVFEFKSDKVIDVYVPWSKMAALDYIQGRGEIIQTVRSRGFTRYPVFKDKQVVGYINIYDIFYNPEQDWREFIRPIPCVDMGTNLYSLFSRMRTNKESIAIVTKAGKPAGIVTLRDLMRAILISIVKM